MWVVGQVSPNQSATESFSPMFHPCLPMVMLKSHHQRSITVPGIKFVELPNEVEIEMQWKHLELQDLEVKVTD